MMEDIIGRYIHIWSETEKIEKSDMFITTKLAKILGLRGYIVENKYVLVTKVNLFDYVEDVELEEIIRIDNKINFIFNHNSYNCYFEHKNKRIKIPYKNVRDLVNFVSFAELLQDTNLEYKEGK